MSETLPVNLCPYCHRDVTVAHRASECRRTLARMVRDLETVLTAARASVDMYRAEWKSAIEERDQLQARVQDLEVQVSALEAQRNDFLAALARNDAACHRLADRLADL